MSKSRSEKVCRAQALLERACVPEALQGKTQCQWKLETSCSLPSNGRGRQTNVKATPPGSTMCANSVEGETQRVARSKQRLHLRLQSGHTIEIQEGEQESRFPPTILACISPQR